MAETSFEGGLGSNNAAGLKETPVDAVRDVERGPRDYVFASLPWCQQFLRGGSQWVYDESWRMTSPYDPAIEGAGALDLNGGTGQARAFNPVTTDLANEGGSSARYWDYYASLYNYYHVCGAKWHVTIENLSPEPLWVHMMYYNDVLPPTEATNEDMLCWKDCESHLIGTHYYGANSSGIVTNEMNPGVANVEGAASAGNTSNFTPGDLIGSRANSPILKLSGSYRPGDFKRQIRLDSEVENWTLTTANPALPERLLLRYRSLWNALDTNNTSNYDRAIRFRYTIKIDYLVEFKELKSYLRWPVERQPLFCAISANAEEDDEP